MKGKNDEWNGMLDEGSEKKRKRKKTRKRSTERRYMKRTMMNGMKCYR